MANIDLQNRAPTVRREQDFRLHVERRYDVLNSIPKSPAEILAECWQPLGTTDDVYTDCYLIDQRVEGQDGDFYNPCKFPPVLLRTYEQLNGLNETQVGDPGVVMDQYGNQSVIIDYWQLNLGTATYQVPGVTPAPAPFAACLLKNEERTNDGTLRKIRRTYIDSGILSDTETLKFDGKLVIREITAIGLTPPTPSGWSLVTTSTEFVNGREVVRVGFASASGGGGGAGTGGEISRDVQYNISPDQGTTGVTVTTIRYVTGADVVVNPITGPVGSELIRTGVEESDGYKIWTSVFASGQGIITSDKDIREGGKLIVYSITSINAPPSAPAPTIGGTVTLITQNQRNGTDAADGTVIFQYTYAEGLGEVGRDIRYGQSLDEGATGTTTTTIRYLTAGTATYQPASLAGSVLIGKDGQQQDGYTLWVTTWAKGTGTVLTIDDTKNEGALLLRTIKSLGSAPATPGGYTLVKTDVQNGDGYVIYTYDFAQGAGIAVNEVETKEGGKLILYRQTEFNPSGSYTPATPGATIGGTVTLVSRTLRNEDGFYAYDSTWAEGIGEISRDTDYSQSSDQGTTGVTKITVRALTALGASNPISVPSGTTLIGIGSVAQDGYLVWTGNYAKGTGLVVTDVEIKEGGKLYIYHRVALGAAPSTPSASIGGVVTLIEDDMREADGYKIYDRRWAEGLGEISRSFNVAITGRPLHNFDPAAPQEDNALVLCTIRYLSAGTAMLSLTDPTTGPSGFFRIEDSVTAQDGYAIWDSIYARGNGLIVDEVDSQNGGKLVLYHRVGVNAAPDIPSPTIGGTVVEVSSSVANEANYKRYDYHWAEGVGEIERNIAYEQSENQGTLGVTLTTIRYLVAPAATVQPTSLAGSVSIGSSYTEANGYRIWQTRWAKGTGKVSEMVHARQDFLREVTYISLGARIAPSVGVIIRDDYRLDEGFSVFTVTAIQAADGSAVTSATGSFERYVPFLYPGRAKAYFLTASNGWKAYDVFRSPPVRTDVKATITVTYQTSNALGTISDYWNPTEWAVVQAEWIGLDNLPGFNVVSLPGYRTTSATPLVFTASVWADGVAGTMLGNIVFGGTIAQVTVTGGPSDPGGHTFTLDATIEPAFTATDGTVYYRKTLVSAAIPAQAALPV